MRSYDESAAEVVFLRPEVKTCGTCGSNLWVCDNQKKFVQRSNGLYYLIRQGVRCSVEACPGRSVVHRVPQDLRMALPKKNYGTDVIVEIGERHLVRGDSFGRIARDFQERGVPLSERHTGRLFRSYVALTEAALGDEKEVCERLRAQGGIVLMADGVQYDNTSPVLYLVWDARSGTPLFGERKAFRGAEDLVPLFERVKAMGVAVIGVVSDKEKGLVPAIAKAFPDVPHQLCQHHFLKNCARGMKTALAALKTSVESRADRAQRIAKRLHVRGWDSAEADPSSKLGGGHGAAGNRGDEAAGSEDGAGNASAIELEPISEEQLVAEFSAMARHGARASGRAPLNPPERVRHERLEAVRAAVDQAQKKRVTVRSFIASMRR